MSAHPRLLVLVTALGLGLTACTNSSEKKDEEDGLNTSIGGVEASWSAVDSGAALPESPFASVGAVAPRAGKLPAIVVGAAGQPGEARTPTVWKAAAFEPTGGTSLEVGGDASAHSVATVEETTYVLGTRWEKGAVESFVQSSKDRETWSAVEVPSAVKDDKVRLSHLTGDAKSGLVAVGRNGEDAPVAVLFDSDETVVLPAPAKGKLIRISGVATSAKAIMIFAEVALDAGGQQTSVYSSTDQGKTWEATGALPGAEATINGAVAVKDGVLAVGALKAGSTYRASAWFSDDGKSWQAEPLPALYDENDSWSSRLLEPTVSDGVVSVASSDEKELHNVVLRRSPRGKWSVLGNAPDWRTPAPSAQVVADGDRLVTLRTFNGRIQRGVLSPRGKWNGAKEFGEQPDVAWWETAGTLGESPYLIGGRQDVSVGESWTRSTVLTPLELDGDKVAEARWQPPAAQGSTGLSIAANDAGDTFVAGEVINPSDVQGFVNESDVLGWFRAADSTDWRPAKGLSGPRTEFLRNLTVLPDEWVIVGSDRASFVATDHSYGAVWTSSNGASWKRQKGPFEVGPNRDSWLDDSCVLPGGDLMVVGGVEGLSTSSEAAAFRRTKGTWKRMNLDDLGDNVSGLNACAGADGVVILQGTAGGRAAVWSSTDGKKFTRVEIGDGDRDSLGTIRAHDGGFIATGDVGTGLQARPVVWVSSDGTKWEPLDIPAERWLGANDLTVSGDRVVVMLTGATGPGVAVLENAAELID